MPSFRSFLISSLILMLLFPIVHLKGQSSRQQLRYDELISIIINYTPNPGTLPETKSFESILNWTANGFIFKLKLNTDSTGINYISPTNAELDFAEICTSINNACEKDSAKILTLIFDYDFDTSFLTHFLQNHDCAKRIWDGNPELEWPTVQNMISQKNQLICFRTNNTTNTPLIKYLWDYAAEPYFTLDIEPKINGEFSKGELKNKLLYVTSFQFPKDADEFNFQQQKRNINENPYFIGHSINLWKNTGKKPNFIVINRLDQTASGLKAHLQRQLSISGTISYNRKPLNKVLWEGDFSSVSYGQYCFPATLTEDVLLKPETPGFRFVPEEIRVEGISKDIIQNFIAIPMELHDNLVAYYPFTNKIEDEGPYKYNTKNAGCKIVVDSYRNEVAEFDGKSFITLPEANTIGISNSDFTVSAWVKLARDNDNNKRDFSIMGTEDNYYRGGLHLQVRMNKPYFGFFSNDLSGKTRLSANQWYHVVWRYTKNNQEQAIFINGKEDGASLNHPAFVSNSNLFIGKSISQKNLYEGCIDDIIIWNRALGEEEIWTLYQDVFYINDNTLVNYLRRNKYWLGIGLFILLLGFTIYSRKKLKPTRTKTKTDFQEVELKYTPPAINAINLFGEFQVIDKNGENITEKFTPRLKQIFILLIISTKEKSHGISSDDFLNIIWPSFERKKAINNRGVSISKLRNLLESLDGVKICNYQERWKIEFEDSVYCDYYEFMKLLRADLFKQREDLNSFLSIIQRGVYLQDIFDTWLDDIKGKVTNKVIDILIRLLNEFDLDQNPELVIQIADRILFADDFNEEALKYKIKALLVLRQTNQAKFTYKSFKERYSELYNEQFPQTFEKLAH